MIVTVSTEHFRAIEKMDPKCVNAQSHRYGMRYGEPLIVMAEALLDHAKAYKEAYGSPIRTDGVLGDGWRDMWTGLRTLLNGQGAVAMRHGRSTDSFDGGTLSTLMFEALTVAGWTEAEL